MKPGEVACSSCAYEFVVPAGIREAVCPSCGEAMAIEEAAKPPPAPPPAPPGQPAPGPAEAADDDGADGVLGRIPLRKVTARGGVVEKNSVPGNGQPVEDKRAAGKTLPYPGMVEPVSDSPVAAQPLAADPMAAALPPLPPDDLAEQPYSDSDLPGDDLPGMVEGEEIDMAFFEGSAEVPAAPAAPPTPPPPPPADPGWGEGSKPLPPLAPADPTPTPQPVPRAAGEIPEAAPLVMPQAPVAEPLPPVVPAAKPLEPLAPAAKPSPKPAPPPSDSPPNLQGGGIEVMVPLAPVEEVRRAESTENQPVNPALRRSSGRDTAELSPMEIHNSPRAFQHGDQNVLRKRIPPLRVALFAGAALIGVAAALVLYWLLG